MDKDKCTHTCCAVSNVSQTLDELDFERGLWYAAQYGDLDRVMKLISQGTEVDARDASGYTSLHYAARNGHLEVCKFLIQKGADINAVTKSGCATALHRAASAGMYLRFLAKLFNLRFEYLIYDLTKVKIAKHSLKRIRHKNSNF